MTEAPDPLIQRAHERVGAVLNQKYRLDRLLGVGGMAAVYMATHRNGNRVALKILHREISLDPQARSRFLLEGYAANNLEHPGTVRVLDDETIEDGSAFLVMELLEGQTLDDRASDAGGALPHREVLEIAHQLLDVLAAAQDKGIVHRDLKPQNLFLTADGALKVLDFGLARVGDARAAHATRSGQVFGTPAFMPPEQALGKTAQIDHQSDLWAVGATMFNLLAGRYVHEAETAAEHVVFAASRPARSLADAARGVPRPIVAIVDRALQFSKEGRWRSARDMQRAVEEAYATLYGEPPPRRASRLSLPGAREVSGVALSEMRTVPLSPPRRTRRAAWVAALLAVAAAGLAAWGAAGGPDPPEAPAAATAQPEQAAPPPPPPPPPPAATRDPQTAVAPAASADPPSSSAPPSPATATAAPRRPLGKRPAGRPATSGSFDRQ